MLATVVETLGSTYRKTGAQMLIAGDGAAAGLLSGGCLEADLMERASAVLASGVATIVQYDTRSSDDILWGIGLGCEGAMTILLTRLDASTDYQPYTHIETTRRSDTAASFALVYGSQNDMMPLGRAYRSGDPHAPPALRALLDRTLSQPERLELEGAALLVVPIERAVRLLVLGAGPDVMPLVEMAGLLDWHVTVLDHRSAYAVPSRFPRAQRVSEQPAASLPQTLQRERFDAAVVMSHHLISDATYLAALADCAIPYIGLLGPAPRRARLMQDIGAQSSKLGSRLYGPIGLDIGARTPQSIALAIVSEIQAVLAGRSGRSFSRPA